MEKHTWRFEVYNDNPEKRQQVAVKLVHNIPDAEAAWKAVDVENLPDGWQIIVTKLR